jgi:type IV pilus assembly protein PilA
MKILRKGEKGFTLIELLIVVAILGILAAVIIPNVNTFINTGKLNAARTEVENIRTAGMAYYADHADNTSSTNGGWPPGANGVTALTSGNYIQKTPIGAYAWTNAGVITGSGYTPFNWDATSGTWIK